MLMAGYRNKPVGSRSFPFAAHGGEGLHVAAVPRYELQLGRSIAQYITSRIKNGIHPAHHACLEQVPSCFA